MWGSPTRSTRARSTIGKRALACVAIALAALFVFSSAAVAKPLITRFEQDDPNLAYFGSWTTLARTFHSAGNYAYTNRAGGKVVARFTGTDVDYITNKDTSYGIAKITLDGGTPEFVDLYNPLRNAAQNKAWHASGLSNSAHVLVIEWTGLKNLASTNTYVGLDAIDVVGSVVAPNMVTSPSAGAGGQISPAIDQSTRWGNKGPGFAITPNTGYSVADVLVDGQSVGAVTAYSFGTMTRDHTIAASFSRNALDRFEQSDPLIAYDGVWTTLARTFHSAGSYAYTNKPGGKSIIRFHGVSADYITNKDYFYGIVKVTLDGGTPEFIDLYNPIRNIAQTKVWGAAGLADSDHVLTVEWTGLRNLASTGTYVGIDAVDLSGHLLPAVMTITPSAGSHGSISPNVPTHVNYTDSSPTFSAQADDHYTIDGLYVDGDYVGGHGLKSASHQFTNVTADHTVSATFEADKIQISSSAGANGTVTSPNDGLVGYGSDEMFTITPSTGYHVLDVTVDGSSVGAQSSYTFTNVTEVHSISATFEINSYTISPEAGANGSISPATNQSVAYGSDSEFTITPDAHHHIADVVVDGVSVGTPGTYTFIGVTTDHTIAASFAVDTLDVEASAGDHGSISSPGVSAVGYGADKSYTITPDSGYHVADVLVDGVSVGAVGSYDFEGVTESHTIAATFSINLSLISAAAGSNGAVSPAGDTNVEWGSDQSYTITADAGHHIADVLVDGSSVGAVSTYDFTDVTAPHTISALFAINTYTLTPSAGSHGAVSPATQQTVDYGGGTEFTFTPDAHYHVADVLVDGSSVGAVGSYEFTNVAADSTVEVSFAIDTNDVAASAGANGSISSAGNNAVPWNGSKSFTITPSTGYHVADVLVDGSSVGAVGSYDFTNVTAAHTIAATFAINTYTITASAASGGSVSPNTPRTVNHGASSALYTFTPSAGNYIADVLVDGVSWGYMPTLQLTNVTGDHSIQVTFGTLETRYEQTDTRIAYSGTWEARSKPFHSGGSYACTRYAGAKVTVKFNGTGMDYITNKDSQYGIVKVTLDGGTPEYVDLYSGERNIFQSKVWSVSGLTSTTHTVVLEYTGTKNTGSTAYWIGLDAVNITGELIQAP
jgi:hypothetical protein